MKPGQQIFSKIKENMVYQNLIFLNGGEKVEARPINEPCLGLELLSWVVFLLHFVDDCFKRLGIIHGEVGKHLAVDFYAGFMNETHELGI